MNKIVKDFKKYNTALPLPCTGHPSLIDAYTEHWVIQEICKHCFEPYPVIDEHVGFVSTHMVQKIAQHAGYQCCVDVTKPYLKHATINQQVNWVENNQGRETGMGLFGQMRPRLTQENTQAS